MIRKNSPSRFLWHILSCKMWPIWIKVRYTSEGANPNFYGPKYRLLMHFLRQGFSSFFQPFLYLDELDYMFTLISDGDVSVFPTRYSSFWLSSRIFSAAPQKKAGPENTTPFFLGLNRSIKFAFVLFVLLMSYRINNRTRLQGHHQNRSLDYFLNRALFSAITDKTSPLVNTRAHFEVFT